LKILVKQGVRGCTLFSEGIGLYSPSVKARYPDLKEPRVIDTVGAGDCFTAAFGVGLCQGLADRDNLEKANEAAFLCVTKEGAMPSMPTLKAL
jgi:ribokinase